MTKGLSFFKESLMSRNDESGLPDIYFCCFHYFIHLKMFFLMHQQMFQKRSQRENREKGQSADNNDDADQHDDKEQAGCRKRRDALRNDFFVRQRSGNGQRRNYRGKSAYQHGQRSVRL